MSKVEKIDIELFRGSPTASDVKEPFHHGWRPAEHENGVSFFTPWEDPFGGFPEHGRRLARALSDTGLPVHLRSLDPSLQIHTRFELGAVDETLRDQYEKLVDCSIHDILAAIYHVVADDALLQRIVTHRWMDPAQLRQVNRHSVLSTVYERLSISDDAVRCLNQLGQVWVATNMHALMLAHAGVDETRIHVVPLPFFSDDPLLKLRGQKRLRGPVRFYHIGKWEPRKAQHEMLGCFLRAFRPAEAKLYLKTSSSAPDFGDYPQSPGQSVERWLDDERVKQQGWTIEEVNKHIHIIRKRQTDKQILQLHRSCDIYLSLSRGEGWDMPAFDSQLAGKLLVYTASGGPQDFAGADALKVAIEAPVVCHPFYRWQDGATYADYSTEHAEQCMRKAWMHVRSGAPIRAPGLGHCEAPVVGERMRELVDELVARNKKELL